MSIEKISNKTLRQLVYEKLKKKIISAEIAPGEIVTLKGLASKFGVSLMPVREALWQLESERVIVIENNRGIRVNTLTAREMEEALRIRIILESIAAERACDLRPESALDKIQHMVEKMEASVHRPRRYLAINSQFHLSIYSFSDFTILLQIINSLWARVGPYLIIKSLKGRDFTESIRCHKGMFQALVEKDKENMRKYLEQDLTQAASIIIPFLENGVSEENEHLKMVVPR